MLIIFLVVLLIVFVSVWMPLTSNMNNDIYKTKMMLMIIPLDILQNIKNVEKVLQSSSNNFLKNDKEKDKNKSKTNSS